MTQYLRVRNWDKFQHYKDRNPPWIKLHRDLLHDYDFSCLQDASKLLLMMTWLLASQTDNKIPANPDWIKYQLNIKGKVCFKELINKGFLEDDSGMLATCEQSAMPETEAKTEAKTEKRQKNTSDLYINQFESLWEIWPKKTNKLDSAKQYQQAIKKGYKHDDIIRGAREFAGMHQRAGTDQKFIPNLAKWIRGERWKDDYSNIKQPMRGDYKGKGDLAREYIAEGLREYNESYPF